MCMGRETVAPRLHQDLSKRARRHCLAKPRKVSSETWSQGARRLPPRSMSGPPSDFTERLVDGFFRRWVLYLLPVVLFVAIGVHAAGNITADYASSARLSATSNPYLGATDDSRYRDRILREPW